MLTNVLNKVYNRKDIRLPANGIVLRKVYYSTFYKGETLVESVAKQYIEHLLTYAHKHGLIHAMDITLSRNLILDLLKINSPWNEQNNATDTLPPTDIDTILAPILDYACDMGFIEQNTTTQRDLFEGKIFAHLTPRQSEIETTFKNIHNTQGIECATDYFYNLSKATNYIKTNRIKKDLYWKHPTPYGDIEITINLSKPEKDPRDIAAQKEKEQSQYPKCLLCIENVGYAGHINHPPRQNHRILPITLGGEQWFFQYSPYSYYNEHCIPLNAAHIPIKISQSTFVKLFDFLEIMPHYFIGSNSDLPISGGSILSHDHFQGGKHRFALDRAKPTKTFKIGAVQASILNWPMSVIRLNGEKNDLIQTATNILSSWGSYNNQPLEIISHTQNTPHNTITPIARLNKNSYELDLVLRNNRTNNEHPLGIFHPHSHLHHIKKENIGLIEVMGLAILPGRLKKEISIIEDILNDKCCATQAPDHHKQWVTELAMEMTNKDTCPDDVIKTSIGNKFVEVLCNAGVFKQDQQGQNAFEDFVKQSGGVPCK